MNSKKGIISNVMNIVRNWQINLLKDKTFLNFEV